jgi:thymidine kinase
MTGHGRNHAVLGSMYSGKSSELHKIVDRSVRHAKLMVVSLKWKGDIRWGAQGIQTHGGRSIPVDAFVTDGPHCVAVIADKGREFVSKHGVAPRKIVVVVDECQFIKDIAYLAAWVKDHRRDLPNVEVEAYYAGLDGTAGENGKLDGEDGSRVMFPEVVALLPLCASIVKLSAVCMRCQLREAPFTRYIGSAADDLDDPFLRLGAEESYQAVCEQCDSECADE